MKLSLSKLELKLLKVLCRSSFTATSLAKELGVKPSFVSRLLKSLVELNLVVILKQGTRKIVSLSLASHSQAFKKLYLSRPHAAIEDWLAGKAMYVLVTLTSDCKLTFRELLVESGCSQGTILKIMKRLGAVGVAGKQDGKYLIFDTLVNNFISSFADNAQLIIQKKLRGYNIGLRIGKHVVIRTETPNLDPEFIETGMNRLEKEGLEAMRTSYNDYYFTLDVQRRAVSVEEAFIHALSLSTMEQHQDFPVLAIFLKKQGRKLDFVALRKYAEKYRVSQELREMQKSLDLAEKLREYNE